MMTHIRNQAHNYIALLVLIIGLIWARGGAERNLWSLRYLWQDTASVSAEQISSSGDRFPNIALWQAQDAFLADELTHSQEKLEPLIGATVFPSPFFRNFTLRLYGTLLEAAGDRDQAFAIWRDIEDVKSLKGAAEKATQAGDLSTARQAYEWATELDPQDSAQAFAQFLWREVKEPSEAEALLRRVLVEYPYANEATGWLHLLGQIYRSEERWDDAIAIYEYTLGIEPRNATTLLRLADAKLARGDAISTIMGDYQQAVEMAPDRPEGYFAIGRLLAQSGEFGRADRWFEQAIARNPESYGYRHAYAVNARDLDDIELTATRFAVLVSHFPENHKAYVDAAWAYHLTGRTTEAKEAIDAAIRLAGPSAPSFYNERAKKIYGQ
ncbi:MAG: tetratricopeptide repeat protein [Chloroflexota bacterium]